MTQLLLGRFDRGVCALAAAVLFAAILWPVAAARAEIEPKYYREWQDKASEVLTIRVGAVKPVVTTDRHQGSDALLIQTRVEAEATVEAVERSGSGLKPGDTIRIQYTTTRSEPPMVGPRPLPVLKRGETVPAFLLAVSKGLYAPAAKGASFEPLIKLR